ncbi:MAG: c-type cytochrome [Acidobacteria bacterium]|nr:c-type cytochrome [Acidobacteriota bacterium]MBI3423722.1 c-type cytochrome [Acidobacteriota bacterium]
MKKMFAFLLIALAFAVAFMAAGRETGMNTVAAADAKAIYDTKCVKCHSADGKGLKSLAPPDFTDAKWQASRTDAQLKATILNGKETMPAFKGALPPADVAALVKLVRGFAPKATAAPKKK